MKRLTLFCGHYGSGKTNVCVNYAMHLRSTGLEVTVADLDIVNPYFRTKDSQAQLEEAGIRVISSPFANSNVDLIAIPSEAYSLTEDRSRYAVLDIGGDERGALALGRFSDAIREENDFEMLCVVNFYRPLTRTAEDAFQVMGEIEAACGLEFTGLVHNSNLGAQTTLQTIKDAKCEMRRLQELSGLPLAFTSADERIAAEGMFPLRLQKRVYE